MMIDEIITQNTRVLNIAKYVNKRHEITLKELSDQTIKPCEHCVNNNMWLRCADYGCNKDSFYHQFTVKK